MTNIVKRLRACSPLNIALANEAADEIERLRAALQRLLAVTNVVADELDIDKSETTVTVRKGPHGQPIASISWATVADEAHAALASVSEATHD